MGANTIEAWYFYTLLVSNKRIIGRNRLGPKSFVATHMTKGKVYGRLKMKKVPGKMSNSIILGRFESIFFLTYSRGFICKNLLSVQYKKI